jgi:hypothetical protein
MTPSPVGGSIHISTRDQTALRQGETVVLHVIKRLDGGKWAVGIAGRVYPALSSLPLEPGATLKARVALAPSRLTLTIAEVVQDAVVAALQRQGVPAAGLELVIARALARSGLPINAQTIQKIRQLLSREGVEARSGARAAATLVDKGIDPGSDAARMLLPVLGFGQKGGGDPRRYKGRPLPGSPQAVREFVSALAVDPGGSPNTLQAYNHIKGRSEAWVVIPFVFSTGSDTLAGTLKILYDPFRSAARAMTLCTPGIGFHLPLQGKRRSLSVFCDSAEMKRAARKGLDSLKSKFHNMGLEVDDTIKEGDGFDGFSPVAEGETLPSVDTVG